MANKGKRKTRKQTNKKPKNDAQADLVKNKTELVKMKTLGNLKLKPNEEVKYCIRNN